MLLSIVLAFIGCSAHYPVVGSFNDFNQVFYGTVDHNLINGTAYIQIESKDSKLMCSGNSETTYIPPISYIIPTCYGQRGIADINCTDGRKILAHWIAKSCTTGTGEGYDQNGNKFSFAYGMKEEEALEFVKHETTKTKEKADLPPVYRPKEVRKKKGFSIGTGFLVTNDGFIITNHHVVEDSNSISVILSDKSAHDAVLVTSDSANDVAILKADIQGQALPIVSTASKKRKGEEVLTLGYPLIQIQGQEQKATFGRINAKSGIKGDVRFLQIDVPIQPGNSGGPLLDKRGAVIGIITATLDELTILRESGALPQNVNYAVKSDYVIPLLRSANIKWKEALTGSRLTNIPEVVSNSEKSVVLVVAK